jgi:multicomponent Na+:H+ antiporter subunit G
MVAALGMIRMPDFYMRMHAATKGPTLGLLLLLMGALFFFHSLSVLGTVTVIFLFIVCTVPVSAHLLAKAAYALGEPWENKAQEDEYFKEALRQPPSSE